MSEFNRLIRLLESELHHQEKLLDVLGRERASIVNLKQDQIDTFRQKKEAILKEARTIANRRDEVLTGILGVREEKTQPKFADVLAKVPTPDLRRKLEAIAKELKTAAVAVQELNSRNAELIQQSIGMVVSTIAIFRSAPGTELPTYSESGTLRSAEDPAFARKNTTIVRDA